MIAIGLWKISQRDDTIHQVNLQKILRASATFPDPFTSSSRIQTLRVALHLFRLKCPHIPNVIRAHLQEDFLILIYLVATVDGFIASLASHNLALLCSGILSNHTCSFCSSSK